MPLTLISTRDPLAFDEATSLAPTALQPSALARTANNQTVPDGRGDTGIWECTPGSFQRQVRQAEYSYIIAGEGSFTPQGGEPIRFSAGDVLYFSADTFGTWDIVTTVRKAYMILA